jgi:hypothetical protein
MPNVAWMRPELRNFLAQYYMIRDVIEGAPAIKGRHTVGTTYVSGINGFDNLGNNRRLSNAKRYLPQPNPNDTSPDNMLRYRGYLERAQFMGVTAQTQAGMRGQIFLREPALKLPAELDTMLGNIDGAGVTFTQQAKRAVDYGLAYGRGGLLADFPDTGGGLSVDQINGGAAQPIVKLYAPWQIINWRIEVDGARTYFSLIVLAEDLHEAVDAFETRPYTQYRVLKINPTGQHEVEIWRDQNQGKRGPSNFVKTDGFAPLDANGAPLTTIPFTFFGALNNDSFPDKPPLHDIAEINIGHYRNSADYEDACYQVGQPTPWAAGLTESWFKNVWGSKNIPLGSRAVVPLPAGGQMGLMQVTANSMPLEAMKHKEDQMIALGAKLIEALGGGNPQTATGELIDETSETSILSSVACNVGAAYEYVFGFCAMFMGVTTAVESADDDELTDDDNATLSVKFNTAFQFQRMSAAERQELVAEWQVGAITTTEMRDVMKSNGIATLNSADYKAEVAADEATRAANAAAADPMALPAGSAGPDPNKPAGQAGNPKAPIKKKPAGKGK